MDLTLRTIVEFRDEMREFRTETRAMLGQHSHRLNIVEAEIVELKSAVSDLSVSHSELKSAVSGLSSSHTDLKATVSDLSSSVSGLTTAVSGLSVTVSGLKVDMGLLLGSVPAQNQRIGSLEARVATLEARS